MSEAAAPSGGSAPISGDTSVETQNDATSNGSNPPTSLAKPPTQPAEDDPEVEFPGRGKKKRSEWLKELDRAKGLERAAHERNRDAARIKQQAQDLWDGLKSNTRDVLKKRGIDPIQFAQQVLSEQMEEAALSDEQKAQRQIQRERDEYKRKLEEFETQKKETAHQAEVANHAKQYEAAIIEAIRSNGLHVDPITVIRMAELQRFYLDEGIELTAKDAAIELRRRDLMANKAYFSRPDMTDAQIDELVPADVQERIRQKYLKQAQSATQVQSTPQPNKFRTSKSAPEVTRKNPNGFIDYETYAAWKKGMHK